MDSCIDLHQVFSFVHNVTWWAGELVQPGGLLADITSSPPARRPTIRYNNDDNDGDPDDSDGVEKENDRMDQL